MTDTNQPETKKRRWLPIVLGLSLGANLLIVGVMAGAFLNAREGGPHRGPGVFGPTGLGIYARALSWDDRKELRKKLLSKRERLTQGRAALSNHVNALIEVLKAGELDETALRTVFDTQLGAANDQITFGQEALIAQIKSMTAQERIEFGDALIETSKKRRKTKKKN
jgi:uncharacterized membrane protein